MKSEVTKTLWICDVCGREGSFLSTCELCGKEYCCVCEFIGYNPLHINICKAHQEDDLMKKEIAKVEKYYKSIRKKLINKLKRVMIINSLKED